MEEIRKASKMILIPNRNEERKRFLSVKGSPFCRNEDWKSILKWGEERKFQTYNIPFNLYLSIRKVTAYMFFLSKECLSDIFYPLIEFLSPKNIQLYTKIKFVCSILFKLWSISSKKYILSSILIFSISIPFKVNLVVKCW